MLNIIKKNELLVIICVQVVLMMTGIGLITPILPEYTRMFGVNITMVGLLLTVYGVARFVADVPAGRVSGRFGCRLVMIAGPAIMFFSSIGAGLADNYWVLMIFRFIQGMGSAFFTTSSMIVLVSTCAAENRGRTMGIYQGSLLLGAGLGPTIGGFVAQYFGIRAPFFALALLTLIALTWAFFRIPRDLAIMRPQTPVKPGNKAGAPNIGFKPLLKDLNFILVSSITFCILFMRSGSLNQLIPLMGDDRLDLSEGQIGIALTMVAALQFATIFLGGGLSDKFGRKPIISLGLLVASISLGALAFSGSYFILLVCCFFVGIGIGISGPTPAAYVGDIVPRENYGTGMGLFRAMGDIGIVAGPLLMGFLADNWGYQFALVFNSLLLLAVMLNFRLLAKEPARHGRIEVTPEKAS